MEFKTFINFKLISLIFCIAGCIFHLNSISKLYFSYQTLTNVKFDYSNELTLPGITICYDKLLQLKDEYFNKISLEDLGDLRINGSFEFLNYDPAILFQCFFIKNALNESNPKETSSIDC